MSKAKKWAAVASAGLAVLMLTVVALPAAAADTVTAPLEHRGGGMGGGASDTYLAEALGITADELQAAKQASFEAAIDQALDQGLITQAQADTLKERSESTGSYSTRQLVRLLGSSDSAAVDKDALLADALGISVDELAAARVEAQDLALAAAVEDGRITQEQADQSKSEQALKTYLDEQGLWTKMQTLWEDAVNQAVAAGVLTQEQADTILENQGAFGMFGHHGGMRGPRGQGRTAPSGDSTDLAPQQDSGFGL